MTRLGFLLPVFVFAGAAATAQHCDLDTSKLRRPAASAAQSNGGRPAVSSPRIHTGMVWIPGGEFWMGAQSKEMDDALPVHRVAVEGFWIDRTTVTNAQFAEFIAATHYVTVAERPLDPKDFPDVSAEKLKPGGVVFSPPSHPTSLEDATAWWSFVPGANWRHPDGPNSDIRGGDNDPVVQVAWTDAAAYAKWAHKRLPTEAEFEFAAAAG